MQEKSNWPNAEYQIVVKAQYPDVIWRQPPWCFTGIVHKASELYLTEADYRQAQNLDLVSDHGEICEIDLYAWGHVAWHKEQIMNQLAPCPFCKLGLADVECRSSLFDPAMWYVICKYTYCRAQGPKRLVKQVAIDAWNQVSHMLSEEV